jgi:hypothetical protein
LSTHGSPCIKVSAVGQNKGSSDISTGVWNQPKDLKNEASALNRHRQEKKMTDTNNHDDDRTEEKPPITAEIDDGTDGDEAKEEEPRSRPNLRFLLFSFIILIGSSVMLVWFARDLPYMRAAIFSELKLGDAMKADVRMLTPERVAEIDGTPSSQRTIAFQESGKLFSIQNGAKKMAPLTGLSHFYVEWSETASQNAGSSDTYRGAPTHFRGRLTTRESLGPVYDKVWVFFDCLSLHGIRQCGLCMGRRSLDDCRNAFVCAENNKEDECRKILGLPKGSQALDAVTAEARAVVLEELDTTAGRLQQTAEMEKSSYLSILGTIRARVLRLRAQVLRIRSKKVFDRAAALDKASLEKVRRAQEETARLKKEESEISALLKPMKALARIGAGISRLHDKVESLSDKAALLSDAAAKKFSSAEANPTDGIALEKMLSEMQADIMKSEKSPAAPSSKSDRTRVSAFLKALSARLSRLDSSINGLSVGNQPELDKWSADADPSGDASDAEIDKQIIKGLADLDRMMSVKATSSVAATPSVAATASISDSQNDLKHRYNVQVGRLNTIREQKKLQAAVPGFAELFLKEQIETVEKSLKDTLSFDDAAQAMLSIQLLIAEITEKKLYLTNFKDSPQETQAVLAVVSDAEITSIRSALKDPTSALQPPDYILVDGELPIDKLWVAVICVVLLLMVFSNGRKIVRFITAYRKK